MNDRLKLAVFDVDGTLVDSLGVIARAVGLCFTAAGLEKPHENNVRAGIGLSLEEAIERLVPAQQRTPALCASLVDGFRREILTMRTSGEDGHSLYNGVIPMLEQVEKQGWLMAVATGNSQKGLAAVYQRHDIAKYFIANRTADICAGKPAPAMLTELMAETGTDADRTIIIGDSVYDMLMGVNAKTKRLGVSWGYCTPQALSEAGAQQVADKVEAIPDLLEKLVKT